MGLGLSQTYVYYGRNATLPAAHVPATGVGCPPSPLILANGVLRPLLFGDDVEDPAALRDLEVDAAWDEEIKRLVADLEAGLVETLPAEEVFAEACRHLNP